MLEYVFNQTFQIKARLRARHELDNVSREKHMKCLKFISE